MASWQEELDTILRVMVNDADETTQQYTDDRLEQTLVVAARLVLMELDFPVVFTVDVVKVSISPDPTDSVGQTRDDNFNNLVCAKAACIIDRGSAMLAANQAIMVKDGTSQVDLRDQFKAKMALLQKGWCAVYEDMKDEYIIGQSGVVVGAAILSPFRVFAGYYDPQRYAEPRWPR